MVAPIAQVRDSAAGVLEIARTKADELVQDAATTVTAGVDRGADQVAHGVTRAVGGLPGVNIAPRRRYRRWLLIAIVAAAASAGLVVVLRRWRAAGTEQALDVVGEPEMHVVQNESAGWDLLVSPDSDQRLGHAATQTEAIEQAEAVVAPSGGDIVVHGPDGEPQDARHIDPDAAVPS